MHNFLKLGGKGRRWKAEENNRRNDQICDSLPYTREMNKEKGGTDRETAVLTFKKRGTHSSFLIRFYSY